ncbi:MAG: DUF805 domain-containing protein [Pseudomonadota bacterium]
MSETAVSSYEHRKVSFVQAFSLFFKNYANFKGRSARGAYWWWYLWSLLIGFALGIADAFVFGIDSDTQVFGVVFSLATLIPSLALAVRRLHDVGRSGWWLLLILTIIGILVILFWNIQPADEGTNKYGDDVEAGRDPVGPTAQVFE